MPQRFTIEDIEVQDCSGVIFRAVDTTTDETVAVRRFFPFGPTGGGLTADEQDEYISALEHLETIAHPSLRSIVSGGCDPVDGIPFIATEWVEGISLRHILAERTLTRAEVTALLVHALEACEALSAVLGREGVWIETDPQTIIIGAVGTHRPITFWISPLRWLGQLSGQRGMEPLVVLTEAAMGWSGEPPESHGASGLAGWLEWLRHAGRYTGLAEARERLTATVGKEAGPATHRPRQATTQGARPDAKKTKKKSRGMAWILGCCILAAAGLAGWILIQKNQQHVMDASEPLELVVPIPRYVATRESDPPESTDYLSRSTAESPSKQNRAESQSAEGTLHDESAKNGPRNDIDSVEKVHSPGDWDLLSANEGLIVKLQGTLVDAPDATGAGVKIYLNFSKPPKPREARGYVLKSDLNGSMSSDYFQSLVGKKIQIEGILEVNRKRPEIRIKNMGSITEP